jgi:hypothetical protein
VARPKKELPFDEKVLQELAAIGCTNKEIAVIARISHDSLTRRFAYLLEKGREDAKCSLRRVQWASAMSGNVVMQIWLGKQLLGQRDHHELSGPGGGAVPVQIVNDVAGPIPAGGGNGAKAGGHD